MKVFDLLIRHPPCLPQICPSWRTMRRPTSLHSSFEDQSHRKLLAYRLADRSRRIQHSTNFENFNNLPHLLLRQTTTTNDSAGKSLSPNLVVVRSNLCLYRGRTLLRRLQSILSHRTIFFHHFFHLYLWRRFHDRARPRLLYHRQSTHYSLRRRTRRHSTVALHLGRGGVVK